MWKKATLILLIVITGAYVSFLSGCDKSDKSLSDKSLIVYSGKGLKNAMEEVKQTFEQKHGISLDIIYAGSNTLLSKIQTTTNGDVFIPGSIAYIKKAGDLVAHHQFIALHVPAFSVRIDNPKDIQFFDDLSSPGVRIAVGNKDKCAIGKLADQIISTYFKKTELSKNIIITTSTVNELLDLVIQEEVDAALIWQDMLKWPEASDLKMIEIPIVTNRTKEIHAAVLTTTTDRKSADLFADFMSTEGRSIFVKHGFGEIKQRGKY